MSSRVDGHSPPLPSTDYRRARFEVTFANTIARGDTRSPPVHCCARSEIALCHRYPDDRIRARQPLPDAVLSSMQPNVVPPRPTSHAPVPPLQIPAEIPATQLNCYKQLAEHLGRRGGLSAFRTDELEALQKVHHRLKFLNPSLLKAACQQAQQRSIVEIVFLLQRLHDERSP